MPTPYAPVIDGALLAHDTVGYAVAWLPLFAGFFAILVALYIINSVVDIMKGAEANTAYNRAAMVRAQHNAVDAGVSALSSMPYGAPIDGSGSGDSVHWEDGEVVSDEDDDY